MVGSTASVAVLYYIILIMQISVEQHHISYFLNIRWLPLCIVSILATWACNGSSELILPIYSQKLKHMVGIAYLYCCFFLLGFN